LHTFRVGAGGMICFDIDGDNLAAGERIRGEVGGRGRNRAGGVTTQNKTTHFDLVESIQPT